jgi:hypothetical protein
LKPRNERLKREIITIMVIKLLVLAILWWFFFHDAHVVVDSQRVAEQFNISTASPPVATATFNAQGDIHDQ